MAFTFLCHRQAFREPSEKVAQLPINEIQIFLGRASDWHPSCLIWRVVAKDETQRGNEADKEKIMRKQLITIALGFSAICGASFLKASELMAETGVIPFDFQVGDTKFTAGEYRANLMYTGGIVQLRSSNGPSTAFCATVNVGGNESQSKLVFHKYGERYFLAEVWFEREQHGHKVMESKREKEIRAILHDVKPQTVYLAMR
jgi:hypothetical protein